LIPSGKLITRKFSPWNYFLVNGNLRHPGPRVACAARRPGSLQRPPEPPVATIRKTNYPECRCRLAPAADGRGAGQILIAHLLQSSFRDYDRVFRFGGEEFVVLLRSTRLENARKVIDRFRDNVARHAFPQVGRVTVSVGFVSIGTNDAPVAILGHADQALYYAKSHGRNRSCHDGQLVSEGLLATVASNHTAGFF
jgi:hypothetical protein